jgi:hypothetical protein
MTRHFPQVIELTVPPLSIQHQFVYPDFMNWDREAGVLPAADRHMSSKEYYKEVLKSAIFPGLKLPVAKIFAK